MEIARRKFNQQLLSSLLTVSLVETLCRNEALGSSIKPLAAKWLAEVEEISRGMKNRQVRQIEWQQKIEELFARIELKDLLHDIDFARLTRRVEFPDDREAVIDVDPKRPAGLPEELSFSTFIYGLKKGRAIVPHSHRNMTSLHLVIGGELHGWHFDRVADEAQHLLIKPTMDQLLRPGAASTASDEKDNIHWFKAVNGAAFTFNLAVYGVDATAGFGGRQFYLDPTGGEKLSDGTLRVRRLRPEEAFHLYGKS